MKWELVYFIELDDVGVSHLLENVNLASDTLHICLVFDLILFEYLNRNLLICYRVCSDPHFAKCALSQRFT